MAANSLAILLFVTHNLAATVTALLVFAAGPLVYVGGYLIFAAGPRAWPPLLVGFVLAGTGIGLAETAESTVVARGVPDHLQ